MTEPVEVLATWNKEVGFGDSLKRAVQAGVTGVRVIAKGYRDEQLRDTVERVCSEGRVELATFSVFVDLPGSKPRLLRIEPLRVRRSEVVYVFFDDTDETQRRDNSVPTEFLSEYADSVEIGHQLVLIDGTVRLRVVEKRPDCFVCVANADVILTEGRSINLPDSAVSYSALSAADRQSLLQVRSLPINGIIVSMTNSPDDVENVRRIASRAGSTHVIIAKVETSIGLLRIAEICACSDCIMLGRGDLSIECGLEQLALHQSRVIAAALTTGTPLIVATGILSILEVD